MNQLDTIYFCAFAQTAGHISMVVTSITMATATSLTGIHPNIDPGIAKFKPSIASWFKRDMVEETGSVKEGLDFSSFFSSVELL